MTKSPPTWQIIAAFAAVYIIWGSTYLAIRYASETLPPFLMAGARFLLAGALLFVWTRARGAPMPKRIHWRSTFIIGALLLLCGNGFVTWAEGARHLASGIAALLVAIVPLWMVLIDWVGYKSPRPGMIVFVGLFVGLIGIALLVGPDLFSSAIDPLGVGAILLATFGWANGSLYSRRAPLPASPLQTTAMEMLCGGALLMLASGLSGEWANFDLANVSTKSWIAVAYLVIFGSSIAFTAYVWLLGVVAPARVATYAYINPVVAVFLGTLAGEEITLLTVVAAAVIVSSVVIITSYRPNKTPKPKPSTATPSILPNEAS